jgi:hypothetical protein
LRSHANQQQHQQLLQHLMVFRLLLLLLADHGGGWGALMLRAAAADAGRTSLPLPQLHGLSGVSGCVWLLLCSRSLCAVVQGGLIDVGICCCWKTDCTQYSHLRADGAFFDVEPCRGNYRLQM